MESSNMSYERGHDQMENQWLDSKKPGYEWGDSYVFMTASRCALLDHSLAPFYFRLRGFFRHLYNDLFLRASVCCQHDAMLCSLLFRLAI